MSVTPLTSVDTAVEEALAQELAQITTLENHWLLGNANFELSQVPQSWQPLLAQVAPAQRQVYALILSQQQKLFLQQEVWQPSAATGKAALPELPLPCLPARAHALFHQVKGALAQIPHAHIGHLLHQMAALGYSVPPQLWLPKTQDGRYLPALYLPWWFWVRGKDPYSALDVETWSCYTAKEIFYLWTHLYRQDAAKARTLLMTFASKLPKESGAELLKMLSVDLTVQDQALLETCLQNKHLQVRQVAQALLWRLQDAPVVDEEALALLKNQLEYRHGRLSKISTEKTEPLATPIAAVPYIHLAQAFDLSPHQLVLAWREASFSAAENQAFWLSVVCQLPTYSLEKCLTDLVARIPKTPSLFKTLVALGIRLTAEQSQQLAKAILSHADNRLAWSELLALVDQPLTDVDITSVWASAFGQSLAKKITKVCKASTHINQPHLIREILALGWLVDAQAASTSVKILQDLGVSIHDTALDTHRLTLELTTSLD
ncbi:hypothetical protein SAMN05421831_103198 [Allopseudospirillum japonicum]|uniref:Uncharacterized protein n=1 Tax=Allopseudospirillum japonicum TaxID=64971 RepID=A0A1H6R9U2_9GAMM|nr:DUF5691 domain-containing protein [Allopseudospirillum japonicum]SEI52589.1 hypothetical protein SAMN05421831_103198 [Allopseudospirillum japonicum]